MTSRIVQRCAVCKGSGLLLRSVCPLCDGVPGWPEPCPSILEMNCRPELRGQGLFREFRAIHDSETVRVYQAYNADIAVAAAAANSFQDPLDAGKWSSTRMTWIKPSAVWMAYRCGWTVMKDSNQARVLALDVSRPRLESMLMGARISHDCAPGECKNFPVVVQWDPERFMSPDVPEKQVLTSDVQSMRSIQIGLRGASVEALLDPEFVLKITDVTESFRRAHQALTASPPDVETATAELWPERQEVAMLVPLELRKVLAMDC